MPEQIETEVYGIFSNIDHTILKLNPILLKHGYEFEAVSLSKLELQFSEVFNIPRHQKPQQNIIKSITMDGVNSVSEYFDDALNYYFPLTKHADEETILNQEVYLLKLSKNINTEHGDNYYMVGESEIALLQISVFSDKLIRVLRLYKEGQINFQGYFSIFKKERKVLRKIKTADKPISSKVDYTISSDDISVLSELINSPTLIPPHLSLAVDSFELTYKIPEPNIKFTLLIIALESIFNRSSLEPIRHIISRHTAILLSSDTNEFDLISSQVKKLYDTRSKIVHGSMPIQKSDQSLIEQLRGLENIVRKAISRIILLNDVKSKDELYEYLNKKGLN